jgi:hypothetical protein
MHTMRSLINCRAIALIALALVLIFTASVPLPVQAQPADTEEPAVEMQPTDDAQLPEVLTDAEVAELREQVETQSTNVRNALPTPKPKIAGNNLAEFDRFGSSAAASGEIVVLGAPLDDTSGTNAGAAYVFARNQGGADNWGQVKKLLPPQGQGFPNGNFGVSVAVSADVIAVGAPGASATGVVYLYARNQGGANNWGLLKEVRASQPEVGARFGAAVALDDQFLLVGAPLDDTGGSDAGSVYLYHRQRGGGENWGIIQQVAAGVNPRNNSQFGAAVALDSGIAVIGAPGYAANRGMVRFMRYSDMGLSHFKQLIGEAIGQGFGFSVAIHEHLIAIGAPFANSTNASRAGMVYVLDTSTVTHLPEFETLVRQIQGRLTDERFGASVAIHGDKIAIGVPLGRSGSSANPVVQGRVDILTGFGQGHSPGGTVFGSDARTGDQFGTAVAMTNGLLVAGAPFHDTPGRDSGAAYLFNLESETQQVVPAFEIDISDRITTITSFAAVDDVLAIGHPGAPHSGSQSQGLVGIYRRAHVFEENRSNEGGTLGEWTRVALLLPPLSGDQILDFGRNVAIDGQTLLISARNRTTNRDVVYIHSRQRNGFWGRVRVIEAPSAQEFDFGRALAVSGDVIALGSMFAPVRQNTTTLNESGVVHIYQRDLTRFDVWNLQRTISAPQAVREQFFGEQLALSNDILIVTSPVPNASGQQIFFFRRNQGGANAWGNVSSKAALRTNVSVVPLIDADTAVVATGESNRRVEVVIYSRNQGGAERWGEQRRFSVSLNSFEFALALRGNLLAVGLPGSNAASEVRLYERNIGGNNRWGEMAYLRQAVNASNNSGFGQRLAFNESDLVVGSLQRVNDVTRDRLTFFRPALRVPAGLALEASANPVQPGTSVTLTARITAEIAPAEAGQEPPRPQGNVEFFAGEQSLGVAPVNPADGTASLSVTLPESAHVITATYDGGPIFGPCEAPPITLVVSADPNAPVPGPAPDPDPLPAPEPVAPEPTEPILVYERFLPLVWR